MVSADGNGIAGTCRARILQNITSCRLLVLCGRELNPPKQPQPLVAFALWQVRPGKRPENGPVLRPGQAMPLPVRADFAARFRAVKRPVFGPRAVRRRGKYPPRTLAKSTWARPSQPSFGSVCSL